MGSAYLCARYRKRFTQTLETIVAAKEPSIHIVPATPTGTAGLTSTKIEWGLANAKRAITKKVIIPTSEPAQFLPARREFQVAAENTKMSANNAPQGM
ncbi:Uncharacterised protein [Mycobacteroides abscessus subsp. abscessus]|nr:Uncharacterised protein [Mycobacteroides abscessus subsp. abscessus]